jgi:hypothetical protein
MCERHTFRLSRKSIAILDHLKDAGCYPSRNAALEALILSRGPRLAEALEQSLQQGDVDPIPARHQGDSSVASARHQGDTEWETLISNA